MKKIVFTYNETHAAKLREDTEWIYIITNPAWEGYYKVGKSNNPEKRLKVYQTSSPHRDYVIEFMVEVRDTFYIEKLLKVVFGATHEWIQEDIEDIKNIIINNKHLASWENSDKTN